MKTVISFVSILTIFFVNDLCDAQRVNNLIYNPNARVVRARMGPFGAVRFVQRGYLSERFFDSLDANLPGLYDLADSIVGRFVPVPMGQVVNQASYRPSQSAATIQQLKAVNYSMDSTQRNPDQRLDQLLLSTQSMLMGSGSSGTAGQFGMPTSTGATISSEHSHVLPDSNQSVFEQHYQYVRDSSGQLHPAPPITSQQLGGAALMPPTQPAILPESSATSNQSTTSSEQDSTDQD